MKKKEIKYEDDILKVTKVFWGSDIDKPPHGKDGVIVRYILDNDQVLCVFYPNGAPVRSAGKGDVPSKIKRDETCVSYQMGYHWCPCRVWFPDGNNPWAYVSLRLKTAQEGESVRKPTDKNTFANLARQLINDVAPQVDADRRKAQLAWIRKVEGCSQIEKDAALLETEGMTLSEIAKHLPHKNGKAMTPPGNLNNDCF